MSWACGRRSIGKTRANRSGSSSHPPAICGVSDEVAQVSMTSGSPTKPPGSPALVGGVARRARRWTGRRAAGPRRAEDRRVVVDLAVGVDRVPDGQGHAEEALPADVPVAGQPLDPGPVAVGHVRRGASAAPRPGPGRASRWGSVSTNHWRDDTISRGRSPFSKNLTGWVIGRGSPMQVARGGQQLDDPGLGLLDRRVRPARRRRRRRPPGRRTPSPPCRTSPAAGGRRDRRRCGWAGRAHATRPRRWCRRRCRSWRCRTPSRGRPARGRRTGTRTPNSGVVTSVPNSGR